MKCLTKVFRWLHIDKNNDENGADRVCVCVTWDTQVITGLSVLLTDPQRITRDDSNNEINWWTGGKKLFFPQNLLSNILDQLRSTRLRLILASFHRQTRIARRIRRIQQQWWLWENLIWTMTTTVTFKLPSPWLARRSCGQKDRLRRTVQNVVLITRNVRPNLQTQKVVILCRSYFCFHACVWHAIN